MVKIKLEICKGCRKEFKKLRGYSSPPCKWEEAKRNRIYFIQNGVEIYFNSILHYSPAFLPPDWEEKKEEIQQLINKGGHWTWEGWPWIQICQNCGCWRKASNGDNWKCKRCGTCQRKHPETRGRKRFTEEEKRWGAGRYVRAIPELPVKRF